MSVTRSSRSPLRISDDGSISTATSRKPCPEISMNDEATGGRLSARMRAATWGAPRRLIQSTIASTANSVASTRMKLLDA